MDAARDLLRENSDTLKHRDMLSAAIRVESELREEPERIIEHLSVDPEQQRGRLERLQ